MKSGEVVSYLPLPLPQVPFHLSLELCCSDVRHVPAPGLYLASVIYTEWHTAVVFRNMSFSEFVHFHGNQ